MKTLDALRLSSAGIELDTSPEKFGELRRSDDVANDFEQLRARMKRDGYLFLPGYLQRDEVMAARRAITDELRAQHCLDENFPADDAIPRAAAPLVIRADLTSAPALQKLLYDGAMMRFYESFLGGAVRHFDYTWLRVIPPGAGTPPHMDIVYMGRGTTNLFTSWTPLGDVPLSMGGLMVLENSHLHEKLNRNYGSKDVDKFCKNRRAEDWSEMGGGGNIRSSGALSPNPARLRERLGGRWLTADFAMGDLLIFSMFTVHASLDNQSDGLRFSSDSRYQLASEPADERWIGDNPIAHGPAAKRGMIC